MPQMYKLQQATHLKLTIKTENRIGVGRRDACELIPNTKAAQRRLNFDVKETPISSIPKNFLDTTAKYDMLRPYQQEDAIKLSMRKNMGVFNEQRTGKTPTSIMSMRLKGLKKILIVCPSALIYTWEQEFKYWMGQPCVKVVGTPKQKQKAIDEWTHGLVIGYDSIKEIDHYIKDEEGNRTYSHSTGLLSSILEHTDIEGCILDEAHRIRNYKNKTAKAIFKLSKIPNKLALSGTPTVNKQDEIFSILHFLYPSLFTSYWRFVDYYFEKEHKDLWNGRKLITTTEVTTLRRPEELQEFLDKISVQRKRKDIMKWLPDKDKRNVLLEPTKEQKKYINDLKEYFEVEHINTVGVLDTLIRERQICLAPALLGLSGSSPKVDWIKQYVRDYPDRQIIIFSKFTKWLEYLAKELSIDNLYTGKITKTREETLKKDFQSGKIKILLIQIDKGKEGLTLDNADTLIFTDKFPPIGFIEQAEDRLVATTKDKVKEEQVIYSLIMDGTYEYNIELALKRRGSELDLINNYKSYMSNR